MRKSYYLICCCLVLAACDASRIYEKNVDLPNRVWLEDSLIEFEMRVDDASLPYNLYANVRNGHSYPFYNLYLQYTIVDSTGREVKKDLTNLILFDPKTGEPRGSGLGDVFDHQLPLLESYSFPDEGRYTVELQQYMRRDSLEEVYGVGVRLELATID
ncbi:gliding motility lipoprotein GldH [Marinoscillum sp.]|uniref:gliding motility lipoprotein GldH n=1 Tax=Marinoscillum sp. TaxID=2024838 RepID=UPI003BADAD20